MEPPPGGVRDTLPPVLEAVYPAPGAVNVPLELQAVFGFNDWVQARGVRAFIHPPLPRQLRLSVEAQRLRITSASRLQPNTTYRLELPRGIVDLRGNPSTDPYTLHFSTGPALDTGRLEGRVDGLPGTQKGRYSVALYPTLDLRFVQSYLTQTRRGDTLPDSLPEPAREPPMYLTGADTLGNFTFEHLVPGTYSMIAFEDANANGRPDLPTERVGVGPQYLSVRAESPFAGIVVAPLDTTPPRVSLAEWVSEDSLPDGKVQGTIRITFNREMAPELSFLTQAYQVEDAESGESVSVLSVSRTLQPAQRDLLVPPLSAGRRFGVRVSQLQDLQGIPIDTARNRATVTPSAPTSPVPLQFAFLPETGPLGGRSQAIGATLVRARSIAVFSSRILEENSVAPATTLGLMADTIPVIFSLQRRNHRVLEVTPGPQAPAGRVLTLVSRAPTQVPVMPDTVPLDSPALAPVQPVTIGTFTLADSVAYVAVRQSPATWGWQLIFRPLKGPLRMQTTPSTNEFLVDSLAPGTYDVFSFQDLDGNGLWNPGRLNPWSPQEPMVVLADSLTLSPGTSTLPRILTWPPALEDASSQ